MSTDELTVNESLFLKRQQKSPTKKWAIYLIIAAVFVGSSWLYFKPKQKTVQYKTAVVEFRDITINVSATGNLEPTNTVDVGIEVSGTIVELLANSNDYVKKGQVLAKIDTTKLVSQLSNSEAALLVTQADMESAKVSLKNAKNEYDRVQSLFKSTQGNYPSDKEMDTVETTYDNAKANHKSKAAKVLQTEATLQSNEDDLRKAVVRSPLNGIILKRNVEAGQTVVATMTTPILFKIAENLAKMELSVSIDEADIGQVKEGQSVIFTVDAYPKKKFEGTITHVQFNSEIIDGVVTYEAIVTVNNDDLLLRPGMTASAEIKSQSFKHVLSVPNAALRFNPKKEMLENTENDKQDTDEDKVWVLNKQGKPVAVKVKIGQSNDTNTIILKGLSANSKVIIGSK